MTIEYMVITEDDVVADVGQVTVRKRVTKEVTDDSIYTLESIDAEIAKKQERIAHLNGDITELQSLRAKVLAEAKKVKLLVDKEVEHEL
jgi:TolA-binding protein